MFVETTDETTHHVLIVVLVEFGQRVAISRDDVGEEVHEDVEDLDVLDACGLVFIVGVDGHFHFLEEGDHDVLDAHLVESAIFEHANLKTGDT